MVSITQNLDITEVLADYVDNFTVTTYDNGKKTEVEPSMESVLSTLLYDLGEEFANLGIILNDSCGNPLDLREISVDCDEFKPYCSLPGSTEGCDCAACKFHNDCC